jgi:hypothetical protein
MKNIKFYEDCENFPRHLFKTYKLVSIIKVYDYHISDYFYCKPQSKVYQWEDYKYVINVDNGRSKFSVWYNTPKRRWELFDNDVWQSPIKKKPIYVIADSEGPESRGDFLFRGTLEECKEYFGNLLVEEGEVGGWQLYDSKEWKQRMDGFDSDEFIDDVIEGAGWCTENYIINEPELSKEAKKLVAQSLSYRGLLFYENKLSDKNISTGSIPAKSKAIKVKDVNKIFK